MDLPPLARDAVAVVVAALLGALLGALSTADPRWTGWIGSGAAPWLLVAWALARIAESPARAVASTGGGVAAMMLAYEGSQAVLDQGATYGFTLPWLLVTAALAVAAGAWRRWAAIDVEPAVAAGVGAVVVPLLLLAALQVVHRAPQGAGVGIAVASACATAILVVDRHAIAGRPGAACAGALAGTALFALGGVLVVVP